MSKIERLIKEKCPNGVRYVKLKDVCNDNFWIMPSTPKYISDGIPYITSKNIKNGQILFDNVKYISQEDYDNISSNRPIQENDFLISMIGTIGEVGIVEKKDLPFYGQNMYLLRLNFDIINLKYFYYYFTSSTVTKILLSGKNNSNQSYIKTKNIESLTIPLPPIEVQEEIVKILNKFSEIETELETELEVRKKQYQFWNRKLLNNSNIQGKKISQIFNRIKGTPITAKKMKEISEKNGEVRIFAGGKTVVNTSKKNIPSKDIISVPSVIVQSRGLIDFIYYDKPFSFKNEMWAYTCDNPITTKYLYYYLKSNVSYFRRRGEQMGSMPQISLSVTENFNITLPPLEEQERIVKILDKFDKLINDISEGIPAEIEARRQQYEYYRNKLLNFEELKTNE